MKAHFLTALLVVLLSGCATQNVAGTFSYQPVPSERVINSPEEPAPDESAATVIVKRDPGFFGAGLTSVLLVDGKPVAKVKPGEFIQFRVGVGERLFGVAWSDNLGAIATSSTRELAGDIRPVQTYYLRLFPQQGSGVVIERASQ